MRRDYLCHFQGVHHAVCQKIVADLDCFFVVEVKSIVDHFLYFFLAILFEHEECSGELAAKRVRKVIFLADFLGNLAASYAKPVHKAVNSLVHGDFSRRYEL